MCVHVHAFRNLRHLAHRSVEVRIAGYGVKHAKVHWNGLLQIPYAIGYPHLEFHYTFGWIPNRIDKDVRKCSRAFQQFEIIRWSIVYNCGRRLFKEGGIGGGGVVSCRKAFKRPCFKIYPPILISYVTIIMGRQYTIFRGAVVDGSVWIVDYESHVRSRQGILCEVQRFVKYDGCAGPNLLVIVGHSCHKERRKFRVNVELRDSRVILSLIIYRENTHIVITL